MKIRFRTVNGGGEELVITSPIYEIVFDDGEVVTTLRQDNTIKGNRAEWSLNEKEIGK